MINIALLCNNFGDIRDGIGDYSKNIYSEINNRDGFNVEIYSERSIYANKLARLVNTRMNGIISKLIHNIKKENKYNIVVLEYPFHDIAISICFSVKKLQKVCKKYGVKFVISLHEYQRTNLIRKIMINYFLKKCSYCFVTNKELKNHVNKYCKHIYLRDIPSNIEPLENNNEIRSSKYYCFFGLINKAKAFNEMLQAFDNFYKERNDKNIRLLIITSSEINKELINKEYIDVYYSLDSLEVSKIFAKCSFGLLPIYYGISNGNGSFKSLALNGLITIGFFKEKELGSNCISIENVSIASIQEGLNQSYDLSNNDINYMRNNIINSSNKFSVKKIADSICNNFTLIEENKD